MSWSTVEKVLEEAAKHSTFIGKLWIIVAFFFRLVFIMRIGDTIYHDEQNQFTCNIRQPGCSNVCFNKYSPLSFIRFAAFHMISLTCPIVCYMLFAAHKVLVSADVNSKEQPSAGYFKPIVDRVRISKLVKEQIERAEIEKRRRLAKNRKLKREKLKKEILESQKNILRQSRSISRSKSRCRSQTPNSPRTARTHTTVNIPSTIKSSAIFRYSPDHSEHYEQDNSPITNYANSLESYYKVMNLDEVKKNFELKNATVGCHQTPPPSYNFEKRFSTSKDAHGHGNPCGNQNGQNGTNGTTSFIKSTPTDTAPFSLNLLTSTPKRILDAFKTNQNKRKKYKFIEKRQNYLAKNEYGLENIKNKKKYSKAKKLKFQLNLAYFIQTILRLFIELSFLYFFHQHFSLNISPLFQCNEWPCPNTVDCFISRPLEKEFVTRFLYGATLLSILLLFLDIWYLAYKKMKKIFEHMFKKIPVELKSRDTILKEERDNLKKLELDLTEELVQGYGSESLTDGGPSESDDHDMENADMYYEYEVMDDIINNDDAADAMNKDNEDMEAEAYEMDAGND